jgi:hypothetical protein
MFGRAYVNGSWSSAPGFNAGSGSVYSAAMAADNMTRIIYSDGPFSARSLNFKDIDPSGQSSRSAQSGMLKGTADYNFAGELIASSSLEMQMVFAWSRIGYSTTNSLLNASPFGTLSVSDSAYIYWGARPLAYNSTSNMFYFVSIEPDINNKTKVVLRSTVAGSGTWSTEKVFSARSMAAYPSVSVSNSGHLVLAWLEGSSRQDIVAAVYYPGFGWKGPTVIDSYNESAQPPIPLVSSSGEVSVIWSQFTSSMLFQAQFK